MEQQTVRKTFKYKLRPTPDQERAIFQAGQALQGAVAAAAAMN
jgi:hypothetical protein